MDDGSPGRIIREVGFRQRAEPCTLTGNECAVGFFCNDILDGLGKCKAYDICDPGGEDNGIVFPLFGAAEQQWPRALRCILYLLGMLWVFIGVATIADVFMSAIETITSLKKRKRDPVTGRMVTTRVWNDTVANLTLMALGSSAPEILLSVIEILNLQFFNGPLGPSTIIGSAAFNLFIISGICVVCLPEGDYRLIKDLRVFGITCFFSIFAYLWLVIILEGTSPNVVSIEEGILSFLFFPILIILAFAADKGLFSNRKSMPKSSHISPNALTMDELSEYAQQLCQRQGGQLDSDTLMHLINEDTQKVTMSRAQYRVHATRELFGSRNKSAQTKMQSQVVPALATTGEDLNTHKSQIQFECAHYACLENIGALKLGVTRAGSMDNKVSVKYITRDGKAKSGSDYIHTEGRIFFAPQQRIANIEVQIVDDVLYEEEEEFYVDLSDPHCEDGDLKPNLGALKTATITVIDDDLPGVISFEQEELNVAESVQDTAVDIAVLRKGGSTGTISVEYYTESGSAVSPLDFDEAIGTLEFVAGQTSGIIKINIKARGRYEGSESFRLIIHNPTGGATLDKTTDGGEDSCILTINVVHSSEHKNAVDKLKSLVNVNWDKARLGSSNYQQQFSNAWYCNGSPEEQKNAAKGDWVAHFIALPWKIFFAMVPPTEFLGGWLCFFMALICIAIVTALMGDLAGLFGCTLGLPPEITAILFVATGTSLPDLFASKAACLASPYADASIGNITGSNSVNVFLGLGLPWLVASIYWTIHGKNEKWIKEYKDWDFFANYGAPDLGSPADFVVISGDLVFSVVIFTVCALLCVGMLMYRRVVFGGELGGPTRHKKFTFVFFIFLWLVYVGATCWRIFETLKELDLQR